MHSVVELNGLELPALQDIAKSLQIREASSLSKKDLILKIVEAESGISVSSSAADASPRRRG
ncbi:MAG: Rho termination factor N-terminal domain-containing protein, partial [Bacteroidota bacterium]